MHLLVYLSCLGLPLLVSVGILIKDAGLSANGPSERGAMFVLTATAIK
jgi:hypothetical protein